jgi:hypothetical protein|tara:strand:+ start:8283 stop:9239 length:957 start_codon:yes stop_codon:yes gene_type:complete
MGITVNYYLDTNDFQTATAVYTDNALTVLAPDGWYSYSNRWRKQTSGVLGSVGVCPSCNQACSSSPFLSAYSYFMGSNTEGAGVYNLTIDTGSAAGINRMFLGRNASDCYGIQIVHDSAVVNNWITGEGYESPGNSDAIWMGDTTVAAGTVYTNQPSFTWNGTSWVQSSTNVGYTVNSTTNFTTTQDLYNLAVFSKTTAVNTTVQITVFIPPFSSSGVNTNVLFSPVCSALLIATPYNATSYPNPADACNATGTTDSVFIANATSGNISTDIIPVKYSYAFTNTFGTTAVGVGYYKTSQGYMQVDSNGVVIDVGSCPP